MHLLFDIQTGVAGDMILGALFDLGLDFQAWKARMASLPLPEMELEISKVTKQGLAAIQFHSRFPHEHAHRGLAEIGKIIADSDLPATVRERSMQVFTRLAQVEARIHGVSIEQVHFHELGALDAIVDIAGACLGFEMLGIQVFYTTPFTFGTGHVMTQHGRMAVPVPATLALTEGFPVRRTALNGELCTPTGTALVTTLARPLPPQWVGTHLKQGYGAGSRDLPDTANVLRVCLLESRESDLVEVIQVECNLDNLPAELIGYAAEKLLASGCKDVWQEPIFMKKNRAAVKLCALVERTGLDAVLRVFASETTTGGIRYFPVGRLIAEKSAKSITTFYGKVDLKGVRFPGMDLPRFTPEYESCRRLALEQGIPLPEVYRQALAAAAQLTQNDF